MQTPDIDPNHERQRLEVLHACGILDSPRDRRFDDITTLAASVFEVPIALISFVDQDRQWFKSTVGLDVSQTPRASGFCDAAIHGSEVMVVSDATQDPLFMHHPMVTGETSIRFYAGAPLLTADGYALGTLCLIDRVSREFSPQQRAALTLMSKQVVNLLALHKETRSKLQESEQRLTFALDAAEIGEWSTDFRTNVAVRSLQHDRCFGYSEAVPEWGFDTFLAHVHPADRQRVETNSVRALSGHGEYDVEFRVIWPDGTEHWLWSRGSFYFDEIDRPCRVAGIVVDITRRKQSESVSRYLEDRYQQLFEKSMDAVLQTTPDGGVLTANPAACTLFAMSEDELVRRGRDSLIDTRDPRLAAFLQTRSETGHARGELRMRRGDGQLFEAEISSSVYVDPQGLSLSSMVIRDVTARTLSEERLQLTASVFANTQEAIIITDTLANIVDVNASFAVITGYGRDEVLGKNPRILKSDRNGTEFWSEVWGDLSANGHWSGEKWNRHKDGHDYPVQATVTAVLDAHGQVANYLSVMSDITERKQGEAARATLETQLRESQKMEAIGVLAGGVAHDFNNIIATILGYTMLAKKDVGARPDEVLQKLEEIDRAAKRAKHLVQQILTFSRRGVQTFVVQPVRPLVEEAMKMLRSAIPAQVELAAKFAATPLYASADAVQIEQVLINLCNNACQAMQDVAGRIEVGLTEVVLDQTAAQCSPDLPPGRYVRISVSDNGCGMDVATQARIFEPFFTTKEVGQGTGLGLSVVHGIAKGHQGAITVESSPAKGTRFDVYLPAVAAPAAAEPLADAATDP